MVRWEDIHPNEQATLKERLNGRYSAPFEQTPWVEAPKLTDARVAIVTTAAIHRFDDRPFAGHEGDYRVVPGDIDYKDLAMTHSSTNFDRSAYQRDVNVCFPLDHLRALASLQEIGRGLALFIHGINGAPTDGARCNRGLKTPYRR